MKLTESERNSPLWQKITEHLVSQIEVHRVELEKINRAQGDDVLRGQILACRRLLAKGKTADVAPEG
jgi:ribosomal protein L18E